MPQKTSRKNIYKAPAITIAAVTVAAIIWFLYTERLWGIDYEYADLAALDGIKDARDGRILEAERRLNYILRNMYRDGLIEDKATPLDGHEYYKLALTLILAHRIKQKSWRAPTFIDQSTETLLTLQRPDGSWSTDDKDPATTYPNTETTILILIALHYGDNDEAVDQGYDFLTDKLWNGAKRAYRECPQGSNGHENNHYPDDNYLALLFHRDYERFDDPPKTINIAAYLCLYEEMVEPGVFDQVRRRWSALAINPSIYP